jgi:hypothetical protein
MDPTASVYRKCDRDPGNDRQPLEEESECLDGMIGSGETENYETGEEQSQEHARHFL